MRTNAKRAWVFIATAAAVSLVCHTVPPIRGAAHKSKTGHTSKGKPFSRGGSGAQAEVAKSFGDLPLSFEPNQGQAAAEVKFLCRGAGYGLFLTASQALLNLQKSREVTPGDPGGPNLPRSLKKTARVCMTFVGANTHARVEGRDELEGKSNYLFGNDRKNWHTNIPTYARVKYLDVYPGIDVLYYGNHHRVEYDIVVRPGADASRPLIKFEGADLIALEPGGDLLVESGGVHLIQHSPEAYQEEGAVKVPVATRYILKGECEVGFELGAYDHGKPLVIDPQLIYSTYYGGSGPDEVTGVAVDRSGNAYITGSTGSADLPLQNPEQTPFQVSDDEHDAFVAKLNSTGTALVYATYIGGRNDDEANGIAITPSGEACIVGFTFSTDVFSHGFPVHNQFQGPGDPVGVIVPPFRSRFQDAFVTVLTSDGSSLVYSTLLAGSNTPLVANGNDVGSAIAVDGFGKVYVAGTTNSNNFPTKNAFQANRESSGVGNDAFVAKLDPSANGAASLLYSSYLGGGNDDEGLGIAVDQFGVAYVVGQTSSTDLTTKSASLAPIQARYGGGSSDGFIAKVDPTNSSGANSLVYLTYFGGSGEDRALAVAVDPPTQRTFITGVTSSSDFPIKNAIAAAPGGSATAFIAKMNADGTSLFYSSALGSTAFAQGTAIAVDSAGNAYLTGSVNLNVPFPSVNAFPSTFSSGSFVAKIGLTLDDATPPKILFATTFGGVSARLAAIALDRKGNIYVGGTSSGDLPTTPGVLQTSFRGGASDGFVAKIGTTFPDTVGVYDPGSSAFFLRNSNTTGVGDIDVVFGQPGDVPLAGDWDGDGIHDVGIFRPSTGQFLLRQPHTVTIGGKPTTLINTIAINNFGRPGDIPVVGDWDGNGTDTIGVFRNGEWLLRNSNSDGPPDLDFFFGQAGDQPFVGDFDGDGIDTVGLFTSAQSRVQLRNRNSAGAPDLDFQFAVPGVTMLAGDWDGDGVDTVGAFSGNTFLLRNSNTSGTADLQFQLGVPGVLPVVGDWDGSP